MRNRSLVAVLVSAVLVPVGVIAGTAPASAASCVISRYANYTSDYARTTDASGGCASVGVAHYFTVSGISSSIFTGWSYGGDVAQSGQAAQLSSSVHSGS